jgi:hypothetical protein
MFVQIIRGGTPDPAALYARIDHWVADLSPRVSGWLGTTSGVTPAGEFVACVRFESAAAAAHNSGSSEQHTWWEETRPLLTGEIDFQDYDDVATSRAGGPTSIENKASPSTRGRRSSPTPIASSSCGRCRGGGWPTT